MFSASVSHGIVHDGSVHFLRDLDPGISLAALFKVGDSLFLGMDCRILPGVVIGDNVIIGAGSVVTRSISANSVVAAMATSGRPAEARKAYREAKPRLLLAKRPDASAVLRGTAR